MKAGFLAILVCFAVTCRAQYIGTNTHGIPVSFQYEDLERSGNVMAVNYDQSDELIYGLNYKRVLFPVHRGYDTIPGQHIVYASYTLDSLIKTDNSYTVPLASVSGLVLDSIYISGGHVKHSAGNDTLILTLLELDTSYFPSGPVVSVDTIVLTSALSSGNILTNIFSLTWKPNYIMNGEPIGLQIEFTGSLQDTMALLSGYGIYPSPNSCTDDTLDKSRESFFYPNSYAYWSNFNLILPTNVEGDLFYDCNANIIQDTSDSESYIQNWAFTSFVSAPDIGIEDESLSYLTIYPNPASNIIYTKGVDPISVAKVYNCSGACVKTYNYPAFMDITDLDNGIYIFAFEYENRTVHKKVVIQR